MPSVSIQITDQDLISKIQTSYLEDQQKEDLTGLVGDMTQRERGDLIAMIDKAGDEILESDRKYAEDVKNLVREETANTRKEFEAMDDAESEKEMDVLTQKLEEEENLKLENNPINQENHANQVNQGSDKIIPKKHTLFKLILILIVIGGIISGAIWGINYLNNI